MQRTSTGNDAPHAGSRPFYFTWGRQPLVEPFPVERAEHDEFVLQDGRRIYDFISTSFQSNFGHSHPLIQHAIRQQLDRMPIAAPKATFDLKQRVSTRLAERIGLPGGKLFYTVSGAEAVENALKMARQITGRTVVLARQESYHGATLGALSVTGDWRNRPHFTIDAHTLRIPEPHEDPEFIQARRIIENTGAHKIAAVILETVSGTNGVAIPSQAWYDAVQAACRQYEILLIIDEVLCGFGRTGPDFALHYYHLRPDFVCASKGITGGYIPFGAVWTGPVAVEFYADETLACGLTHYAHPLGLAAVDAVLDLLSNPEFQQNKRELEAIFQRAMDDFADLDIVQEVRCRGLLAAIELTTAAPTWAEFFAHGLHAFSSQDTVILAPPLISKPHRLNDAIAAVRRVLLQQV